MLSLSSKHCGLFFMEKISLINDYHPYTNPSAISMCSKDGCLVLSLLILLLFNVGFVVIASCLVVTEVRQKIQKVQSTESSSIAKKLIQCS